MGIYLSYEWKEEYGCHLEIWKGENCVDNNAKLLEKTVDTIEHHGHEVEESRMKKVEKMKRTIQLIKNVRSDEYVKLAEKELGKIKNSDWLWTDKEDTEEERIHNKKVYERAREIEISEWKELWLIVHGQDMKEFSKIYNSKTEEEKKEESVWNDWFDGSGMKSWWD